MDGYKQRTGEWRDSTGNILEYLDSKYVTWCRNNPSGTTEADYLSLDNGCDGGPFKGDFAYNRAHVVCVKCPTEHSVPSGYSCLATRFGIIVIKPYNLTKVSASEARALCAADADYVHLPIPDSNLLNKWYANYAKEFGIYEYWLGFNKSEGTWTADTGNRQYYFNWKLGFEVT